MVMTNIARNASAAVVGTLARATLSVVNYTNALRTGCSYLSKVSGHGNVINPCMVLRGNHQRSISKCYFGGLQTIVKANTEIAGNSKRHIFSMAHRTPLCRVTLGSRVNLAYTRRSYSSGKENKASETWLQRWMAPKEIPPRWTTAWYREMVLICTVFAITGSSTMVLVRPMVSHGLGLKGSMKEGPWSYRICSIIIMTPLYAGLLVVVGTLFGRHAYFRFFAVKMFSRFGIPPELMDPTFENAKKNFRKW